MFPGSTPRSPPPSGHVQHSSPLNHRRHFPRSPQLASVSVGVQWIYSQHSPEILPEQNRSFTISCLLLAAVRLSLCLVRFVFFYFCCILFIFCIVFLFARVFLSCRVFALSGPPYPSVLSVIFSFQSLQLVLGDSREQIIQRKLKGSPSSSALFASKQTKVAELTKCFTHKSTTMMTVGSVGEEVAPKARGYNQ